MRGSGFFVALAFVGCPVPLAAAPPDLQQLDEALSRLTEAGRFSGAVAIRDQSGVRFAKGYGQADPFSGTPFRPTALVDSASLAKPVTAAAVLLLVHEGRMDLDAQVRRYLAEFPHPDTTVRQLLVHAAGLPGSNVLEPLAGKTNAAMLSEIGSRGLPPAFAPGSAFEYCNICYNTLALLVEKVSGQSYIAFVRLRLGMPAEVTIRPRLLADWKGRAVGYRDSGNGLERADSYDDEMFYGSANLSISASGLAEWGARWWSLLSPLRTAATSKVTIGGGESGLALGNWYCAPDGLQCHYIGHHEGFHHMLQWDARRQTSVALVSNGSLSPGLQQRLQRALVAFAAGQPEAARAELAAVHSESPARPGLFRTGAGEQIMLEQGRGPRQRLTRRGVTYDVFPVGEGIGYVPGLDLYLTAGADGSGLHFLSLYEDETAMRSIKD